MSRFKLDDGSDSFKVVNNYMIISSKRGSKPSCTTYSDKVCKHYMDCFQDAFECYLVNYQDEPTKISLLSDLMFIGEL